MLQIGGIVVLFACVFGGYLMSGGSLGVVIEALPHEMLTILRRRHRRHADRRLDVHPQEDRRLAGPGDFRPEMEAGRLSRSALPAVPAHQDDEVQGPDRAGSAYRKARRILDLQALSQDHEGSFRARFHLRHAAHDDHEPGRPASGRNRDGKAAGKAPSRGAGRRQRAAIHGRRPAGAGHRRRRAGRDQDHGRDQRAAGSAGRA